MCDITKELTKLFPGKFMPVLQFKNEIIGYKLSGDALKYPYWEVDSSSWDKDVQDAWAAGYVILNHKVVPVSIKMSKDVFHRHFPNVIAHDYLDYVQNIEHNIMAEMLIISEKILETNELAPGYMFGISVADGSAMYKVTKVNKKSVIVEHRSFGDGYRDQRIGLGGSLSMKDFRQISRFGYAPLFARVPVMRHA
jgi:hypothetical protein